MTFNKKHSFKAPLAAVLAALIGATALLAGCGGNDEAESSSENETKVVTETQVVTRVVDGVYTDQNGEPIKDENGQPMTAPSGTPDTDTNGSSANNGGNNANNNANGGSASNSGSAQSSAGGNGGGNNGGGNNGGGNNGGGSSASQADDKSSSGADSKSSGSSDKKGSGTLSVGGKTYNVGDKVTCTYTLTCKKLLSNFQAMVKYDKKYLKPTNAYLDGPAKAGSVINYELYEKGLVKFNGINLNGYNYTQGSKFLVVEYEVLDGGSTTPEFIWEIASDIKDNALITNHKADSSISLSASFS